MLDNEILLKKNCISIIFGYKNNGSTCFQIVSVFGSLSDKITFGYITKLSIGSTRQS